MKKKILISSYSINNYLDISIVDYDNGILNYTNKKIYQGNNPSYLKQYNDLVYSISETEYPSIYCYNLNLENVFIEKSIGKYPCHIELSNQYIFISNYGSGNVVVFDLRKQTIITTIELTDKSNAHCCCVYGNKLLIADLGANCIWALDSQSNKTKIEVPGGPRQIIPIVDGFYSIQENSNTIIKFDESLNQVKTSKTLTDNNIQSFAGGAALLQNGDILVANRGANSISRLSNDLEIISEMNSEGNWPRFIHTIEDDNIVLVCNQKSGTLCSIDYNTGKLIDSLEIPGISFCESMP